MIKTPIKVIELFAGYGSQSLALKYLGIPIEHHFVCEFDKYAMQSYNDIHGTNFKPTDVREITAKDLNVTDTDNNKYLLTYSFPCTDLSLAGQRKGMQRESGTSSSLLWEVERLLMECAYLQKEDPKKYGLPQYLLMENVPQVVSKDNLALFGEWTTFLQQLGYENKYKILNAKDFGVPQNRERCYMVSILKSEHKVFTFPNPKPLTKRLKDVLQPPEEVEEKYYIRTEKAQKLIQQLCDKGQLQPGGVNLTNMTGDREPNAAPINVAGTLCARDYKGPNNFGFNAAIEPIGYIEKGTGQHQSNSVHGIEGVSPTLSASYMTNIAEGR